VKEEDMKKGLFVTCLIGAVIGVWAVNAHSGDLVDWWDEVAPITVLDKKDIGCTSSTGIKTISCKDVCRYDGHFCPGVAQGFRACQIVLNKLFSDQLPARGDIFVVSGSVVGPVPAIEYITGARYGTPAGGVVNGNLVIDPGIGKESFIFVRMSTGKAYKVTSKVGIPPPEMRPLHPRVAAGECTQEERDELMVMARKWAFKVMTLPEADVFEIEELKDYDWEKVRDQAWNL
jgi:formylmethanofuran dehydrogenase subunit E